MKFWWLPLLFAFLFNLVVWGNTKIKRQKILGLTTGERVMRAVRAVGFYLMKLLLPINLKAGYFIPTGGINALAMECYAGAAITLFLTAASVATLLSASALGLPPALGRKRVQTPPTTITAATAATSPKLRSPPKGALKQPGSPASPPRSVSFGEDEVRVMTPSSGKKGGRGSPTTKLTSELAPVSGGGGNAGATAGVSYGFGCAVAWLSYLVLLLPTVGLVQHGSPILAADRYTYLADMVLVPAFAALCTAMELDLPLLDAVLNPFGSSKGDSSSKKGGKGKGKGRGGGDGGTNGGSGSGSSGGGSGGGSTLLSRVLAPVLVLVITVLVASSREVLSRYRGSLPLWRHAVQSDADDGEARLMYGEALFRMPPEQAPKDKSNMREALEVLTAVFDRNLSINSRPLFQLHFYVAGAYKAGRDFEKSAEHFKAAVTIEPQFDPAQYNLGNVLMYDLQRHEEAGYHYAMASRPGKPDPEALMNAGAAYEKAVEVDAPRMDTTKGPDVRHYEVVHHYKRAIELQPFDPGPRQRLGVYYSRQGRHQRAIVEYRACIKLTRGRHMPCWKNMALGLQAVHQPKLALEAYEKALQLGDKGEKTPQKIQELKAMLAGL
eukprot:g1943.t1